MEKQKLVSAHRFKSVTETGNLCKTFVFVLENGTTHVNQLFLIPGNKNIRGLEKLKTCLGKTLYVCAFGLHYKSLCYIKQCTETALIEGKIKKLAL